VTALLIILRESPLVGYDCLIPDLRYSSFTMVTASFDAISVLDSVTHSLLAIRFKGNIFKYDHISRKRININCASIFGISKCTDMNSDITSG
jgi:hypothetical protein